MNEENQHIGRFRHELLLPPSILVSLRVKPEAVHVGPEALTKFFAFGGSALVSLVLFVHHLLVLVELGVLCIKLLSRRVSRSASPYKSHWNIYKTVKPPRQPPETYHAGSANIIIRWFRWMLPEA